MATIDEDIGRKVDEINRLNTEIQAKNAELADIAAGRRAATAAEVADLERSVTITERKIQAQERELELLTEASFSRKEAIRDAEEENDKLRDRISRMEEGEEKTRELNKLEDASLEVLRKKIGMETDPAVKRAMQDEYDSRKRTRDLQEKQEIQQGKINKLANAFTGEIYGSVKAMFTFDGVVKNISDTFTTIMNANKDFAKQTGQIADRSIMFGYGASQFGIGFEKMNKASIGLFNSMSNFSNLNRDLREGLAVSAAKMENLGIASEMTGKNFQELTLGLKMSATEAITTNDQIARAAIGAGIAPKKMLEEFSTNMPRLAAYGKQAVDVYIDLQKQAKSLGIELSSLDKIVGESFDTYEGSARAAGKLNAVLGGNFLNSVEMLNATESERIMLLKQSFDASGKNFDSLDKYSKKAIAATLGITDLNEASKLFGKSTVELSMDMNKSAASQEKLAAVQREAADVMDQVKQALANIAIMMRPVVTLVKDIIDLFTALNDKMGGFPGMAIAVGTVIYFLQGAFGGLSWRMVAVTAGFIALGYAIHLLHDKLLVPHSPILFFALMALPEIIERIGDSAEKNKKGLIALGVAFMGLGTGVYLAATGFANFANSLRGLTGEQLTVVAFGIAAISAVFIGFIIAVSLLAKSGVGLIGVGMILAFGFAMLMLGAGVFLVAKGFSLLVESIGNFASIVLNSISKVASMKEEFGTTALVIGEFLNTLGLIALSPFTILGIALLIALGGAMIILGIGAMATGEGIKMIAGGLEGITNLTDGIGEKLETIGKGLSSLSLSLLLFIGSFAILGSSAGMIFLGIIAISAGISILSESLNLLPESKINLFDSLIKQFSLIIESGSATKTSLNLVADSIYNVSKALDSVPTLKSLAFATSMQSLNEVLNTTKEVKEEDIKPTKDLISAVKEYYVAQGQANDSGKDALIAAIRELKGTLGGGVSGESGPIPVTLIIDGKSIAAVMKPHLNQKVRGLLSGPSGA